MPSREIFSITVVDSIENGTVTAFPTSAAEDEIISLTVNPAEGYVLDTLTYTVGESEPVDVNETIPPSEEELKAKKTTEAAEMAKDLLKKPSFAERYAALRKEMQGAKPAKEASLDNILPPDQVQK